MYGDGGGSGGDGGGDGNGDGNGGGNGGGNSGGQYWTIVTINPVLRLTLYLFGKFMSLKCQLLQFYYIYLHKKEDCSNKFAIM